MWVKLFDRRLAIYPEEAVDIINQYLVLKGYELRISPKGQIIRVYLEGYPEERKNVTGTIVIYSVEGRARIRIYLNDWESEVSGDFREYWRATIWEGQESDPEKRAVLEGLARHLLAIVEGEDAANSWRAGERHGEVAQSSVALGDAGSPPGEGGAQAGTTLLPNAMPAKGRAGRPISNENWEAFCRLQNGEPPGEVYSWWVKEKKPWVEEPDKGDRDAWRKLLARMERWASARS